MGEIHRSNWKQIINADGVPSLLAPLGLSKDYDGCFGNTNEAMHIVERVAAENTHLTVTQIRAERKRVESLHRPFSTVEFVERELMKAGEGKTWVKDMRPYILERAKESHHRERLLTRGAHAVFAVAAELGVPEVVVTHGAVVPPGGPMQRWAATEWQTIKPEMTPILQDDPLVVTHESAKVLELGSWYDRRTGAFLFPRDAWLTNDVPLYVRSLLHVDDKISALKDWPDPDDMPLYAVHYLPEDDNEVRATQLKGERPRGVPLARGMGQVAKLLVDFYDRAAA